jgi:hypothetical protein
MRKSRKFLQTDFIKFILEKYSNQEGQGLPDDEIEIPDDEQRKRKSIRKLNEFDDEVQDEEEPIDDEGTDDEIIDELLNEYKRLKKKYESNRVRFRRK